MKKIDEVTLDIKMLDEITFKNVHLVAEYLIDKDRYLATALLDELDVQLGWGRELDYQDENLLNLKFS